MAALPEYMRLILVVLILLFAQPLIEKADGEGNEQKQKRELASSGKGNNGSRSTDDSSGDRAMGERADRPQRLIVFTYVRE